MTFLSGNPYISISLESITESISFLVCWIHEMCSLALVFVHLNKGAKYSPVVFVV